MPATNQTPTLGLSQFVGTDKPAWIADYNTDMQEIDSFAAATNQRFEGVPENDGTLQVGLNAEMLNGLTRDDLESALDTLATFNPQTHPLAISPADWTAEGDDFIHATAITLPDETYGLDLADIPPVTIRALAEAGIQLIAQNDNGAVSVIAMNAKPEMEINLSITSRKEIIQ